MAEGLEQCAVIDLCMNLDLGTVTNLLACIYYTFPSRGGIPNRCRTFSRNSPPLPDCTAELVKVDHHG